MVIWQEGSSYSAGHSKTWHYLIINKTYLSNLNILPIMGILYRHKMAFTMKYTNAPSWRNLQYLKKLLFLQTWASLVITPWQEGVKRLRLG